MENLSIKTLLLRFEIIELDREFNKAEHAKSILSEIIYNYIIELSLNETETITSKRNVINFKQFINYLQNAQEYFFLLNACLCNQFCLWNKYKINS